MSKRVNRVERPKAKRILLQFFWWIKSKSAKDI